MSEHFSSGLAVLFLLITSSVTGIVIGPSKCCLQDEILINSNGAYECSKIVGDHNINLTDVLWWLPRSAMNEEVENEIVNNAGSSSYGSQPKCDIESKDILEYMESDRKEFRFHIHDHEIRLRVVKEGSSHNPDRDRNASFHPSTFCVDISSDNVHIVILCPCTTNTCVRTCCYDGEFFDTREGTCASRDDGTYSENSKEVLDWRPEADNPVYYRLENRIPTCNQHTYHVIQKNHTHSQMKLLQDGSIKELKKKIIFAKDTYCGIRNEANKEMVVFCLVLEKGTKKFAYGLMYVVGAIFLLMTVLVGTFFPELRKKIQWKIAYAHNVMLFIAYIAYSIFYLHGKDTTSPVCAAFTIVLQYSLLAASFWLNVMCIDIAFGCSSRRFQVISDYKKFIYFSIYAWGFSALITTVTIIAEYSPIINNLRPSTGPPNNIYVFNNRDAMWLFLYGPMGLLMAANLLLLMYTVIKITRDKRQADCINARYISTKRNTFKLVLFVKLFLVMGVTYVTDVVCWKTGYSLNYFWYFLDFFNLLRALYIFLFFCCTKTVYLKLRFQVFKLLGKKVSIHVININRASTKYSINFPQPTVRMYPVHGEQGESSNENQMADDFDLGLPGCSTPVVMPKTPAPDRKEEFKRSEFEL